MILTILMIQTTITVVETTLMIHTLLMTHTLLLTAEVDPIPVVVVRPQQLPLIGLPKVKLPQSKTKVNAVPAGRSRPLEISLPEELSTTTPRQLITPSNNSLIAPDLSVTMDAVVELWTPLSNMLKPHHLRPQLTTHTKLQRAPAFTLHPKDKDLFLVTPTSYTTVSVP